MLPSVSVTIGGIMVQLYGLKESYYSIVSLIVVAKDSEAAATTKLNSDSESGISSLINDPRMTIVVSVTTFESQINMINQF